LTPQHWEKVKEMGDQAREMEALRIQLKIASMGGGVHLLNQIFKRWMHLALWSGWNGMKTKFMAEYSEYKMMSQLNHMNGKLKQEALRRLHAIINVWAGKACAVQWYNMVSMHQYDKRIARIALQADAKLKKVRKWKWFGVWVAYFNDAKERKHWEQFESMKKEIKELKDQMALNDDEMEKLMEKFLGARHSAFFDKIDRVMKAWRFGTFGLMFSDWVQTTKNAIRERIANEGGSSRQKLLSEIHEIELEMDRLKKQNAALRAESMDKSRAITLRDNEISMLKEKCRSLEARTTTLFDQGFSDGIKDKDEAVSKLMEKFLLTAQGAFLDKVNEILKAWQYGSFGYMFSSWKSYVNAQKEKDNSLEGQLAKAQDELKKTKKELEELEKLLAAEKTARAKAAADSKRLDMERLAKIDELEGLVQSAQAKAKSAKELMESEVAQAEMTLKEKTKELTEDVEEAQGKQRDAEADATTLRTEKKEALKSLALVQSEFKSYEEEAEEREKKSERELNEQRTVVKKKSDKLAMAEDQINGGEKLRKQNQVLINDLSEQMEKLRLEKDTLKDNLDKSREECEDLRQERDAGTK